ncbi:MAG TPA: hypothetical protein VK589_02025 [Chryseolinea sp.]|nr:hypothetical protein [Chryseolinea sp.]
MKMTYLIIGLVLAVGFAFYLTNRKLVEVNKVTTENDSTNVRVRQSKENAYEELRNMAFSLTPDQLKLELPVDQTTVFGVIMDWEMEGATATTVAYLTGDASLYLSTGGAVIGGGQHENVKIASKQCVSIAQTYLAKSTKTDKQSLPTKNQVNFYFLTNKGLFVAQEKIENFENNSSSWLGLFEEGNKVLSELRLTSENR